MKYPLSEQVFIDKWLAVLENPDDGDREFASALAKALSMTNSFYIKKDKNGRVISQVGRSYILQPAVRRDKKRSVGRVDND